MTSVALRADLAVCGVAVEPGEAGAMPGHLLLDGLGTAVPVDPGSKYVVRGGRLTLAGADLGLAAVPVGRPRFCSQRTADGVPYDRLARLHGADVLVAPATVAPPRLAEVARAAVELDGVRQLILTGAAGRPLTACCAAVHAAVPELPIQVLFESPVDAGFDGGALADLHAAGAVSLGLPPATPRAVWLEAVHLFGRNRVATFVCVGLGADADALVAAAAELIGLGVYPLVVAYRQVAGALAADFGRAAEPPSWLVADVTDRVAELLVAAGMRGVDQRAGCAACGACSALQTAGA